MASKSITKAIDKRIDTIYNTNCSGIQISIMDIGKVFEVGRMAAATGANDEQLTKVITEFVNTIRLN